MSTKNPFEIRSDMLKLAKDYLDQQYHMNMQFAEKAYEAGQKTLEEMHEATKSYTTEELLTKAREMYSFVSDKGNN
jgi:hypothetical protein